MLAIKSGMTDIVKILTAAGDDFPSEVNILHESDVILAHNQPCYSSCC